MKLARRVLAGLYRHRQIVVFGLQLVLFALAYAVAYALRFDFAVPAESQRILWMTLPVILAIKSVVFWSYGLNRGLWRYVSVHDLERIVKAATVSSLFFLAVVFLWTRVHGIPRSVVLLDFVLTVAFLGGARFGVRVLRQRYRPQRPERAPRGRPVLIVGAGAAGEQTLREVRQNPRLGLETVGLVDDDPRKRGGSVHGVEILGSTEDIPRLVRRRGIEEILIAVPSATGKQIGRIVELCEDLEVRMKVLPAVGDLIAGKVTVQQFREVQIEDLLGRDHVELDLETIAADVTGQSVLITGAGGSIGSELARQVHRFGPRRLILLDRNENGVFHIERELRANETDQRRLVPVVGDFRDAAILENVFDRCRPTLVYHAAAYKHVPMMEMNPVEAVGNNVLGTARLMETAREHGVARFVLISTDKAVRPKNVMGATKRLAEMIMVRENARNGTKFVAVRFGNVLGSEGSVVPIFRQQLRAGGPLTVTDPEVTRFFMTIPEAVQLVMQAGSMGEGGEIFLLDMGEPVKIVELAERLITLAGKKPYEEIDIEFTGLRPGEKLHEDLYSPEEPLLPTVHEKILVLGGTGVNGDELARALRAAEACIAERDVERLREVVFQSVARSLPAGNGHGFETARTTVGGE